MDASQIYAQNNAQVANAANSANQYQGQYNQNYGQFQGAQANLQNYAQSMPNLGNVYTQNVQQAENQYGVNPQALLQANQGLAATQATMNQLPQAIQQSANGYGLTAAQEAGRYANAANNLSTTLGNQTAGVNAYQQSIQNALAQAQAGTGFTGQSEQLQLGALQNVATNYQQQEQLAAQQLNYFNTLEQQGIQLNVNEQQAQAQAALAYAQAQNAQEQSALAAQEIAGRAALGSGFGYGTPQTTSPLDARQQASAAFLKSAGATPGSIYGYNSPTSSVAGGGSVVDPLTAIGYGLGLVH